MKKLFNLIVMGLILVGMVGCGKNISKNIEGSLTDLMAKLYQDIQEDVLPNLDEIEITSDNIINFLGTDQIEYEEALASEPFISSIAHSVILLRAKEGADIEGIKKEIKDNINPRKWICVGVEPEDVIIENKGNLILVVVVENKDIRKAVENNFLKL